MTLVTIMLWLERHLKKKKKEEESKLLKKILTEFLLSLEGKNFNSQRAAEPFCPNT